TVIRVFGPAARDVHAGAGKHLVVTAVLDDVADDQTVDALPAGRIEIVGGLDGAGDAGGRRDPDGREVRNIDQRVELVLPQACRQCGGDRASLFARKLKDAQVFDAADVDLRRTPRGRWCGDGASGQQEEIGRAHV